MTRRNLIALIAVSTLVAFGGNAAGQPASLRDLLVGTWILESIVIEHSNGSKTDAFGPNPKGVIIFAADGHFSLMQSRGDLPRLASSDRTTATVEEATTIYKGSIAYWGSYTVSEPDKTISLKLAASTVPNMAGGSEQKRVVTLLTANELRFINPRPVGPLHVASKRAALR